VESTTQFTRKLWKVVVVGDDDDDDGDILIYGISCLLATEAQNKKAKCR